MSDLMIIESPNKIRSISKYIGDKDIKLIATVGHIREFGGRNFGYTDDYEIKWQFIKQDEHNKTNKEEIVKKIREAAEKAKNIYLSTDPDREGEAISWHVYSCLDEKQRSKCKRVVFNEITKKAIEASLNAPRELDQDQVNSYFARSILDRRIGFMLSSYTRKKIGGISAGRVQSIALKFLKDREDEINKFIPEYWFIIHVVLENNMELTLKKVAPKFSSIEIRKEKKEDNEEKVKETVGEKLIEFIKEDEAKMVLSNLTPLYKLIEISSPKQRKIPAPTALKTSSLYRYAIRKCNMSMKQAEKTAQKLFEGVEVKGESLSLITYPRTDKNELSEDFLEVANEYITKRFGKKYWNFSKTKKEKTDDSLVQGAHEAIRPTDICFTPEDAKPYLNIQEYKLYELIWVYTVSSLMPESINENINYKFENAENIFSSTYSYEIFDGFKLLTNNYTNLFEKKEIPIDVSGLKLEEKYKSKINEIKKKEKEPPKPYDESSFIKALEIKGIGRPSTFNTISSVVLNRNYAIKEDKRLLITDLGLKVSKDLDDNFSNFINYDYTRNMEKELDNISEAKTDWKNFLDKVFEVFDKDLDIANKKIPKVEHEVVKDRTCPKCSSDLYHKVSKLSNKKFISCSKFPKCKYSEFSNEDDKLGRDCPNCQKALVKKRSKSNQEFISCSGYPECKYTENTSATPPKQIDKKCPDCQKHLVQRINKWKKFFISCSGYPECKYIENENPPEKLEVFCPECGKHLVKRKNRWNAFFVSCSDYPTCKFIQNLKKTNNESK